MEPWPSDQEPNNNMMQPPPNREPSSQACRTTEGDTPALAPDTTDSGHIDPSVFRSADAFRKLFESGAADDYPDLFKSTDFSKWEAIFKSGDMNEIDKLMKSGESQKICHLFQSTGSLSNARSTSTGSQRMLPGVFESKDWASGFASSHVDVDPTVVFRSEEAVSVPSVTPAIKTGTDWNALYEASLPTVPIPTRRTKDLDNLPVDQGGSSAVAASIPFPNKPLTDQAVSSSQLPPPVPLNPSMTDPKALTNSRKRREPTVKQYHEPLPEDVLLGRGGRTNHHPGNKRYLAAKESIQPRYLAAAKQDKTAISQELVDVVKAWGGRFLELDPDNDQWFEITDHKARKKASQTLREINTAEERAAKRAKYGK